MSNVRLSWLDESDEIMGLVHCWVYSLLLRLSSTVCFSPRRHRPRSPSGQADKRRTRTPRSARRARQTERPTRSLHPLLLLRSLCSLIGLRVRNSLDGGNLASGAETGRIAPVVADLRRLDLHLVPEERALQRCRRGAQCNGEKTPEDALQERRNDLVSAFMAQALAALPPAFPPLLELSFGMRRSATSRTLQRGL